jgi:topoisomerase-4 subunit A
LKNGDYYLAGFDANVHFEDNIDHLEKYEADKVWSCVLYDADNQGYPYVKRFLMEASKRKQNYIGENENSQQILLTDTFYPRLLVTYGGNDEFRGSEEIDVEQFISVKGFKAKGKRLTTWQIESIEELPPVRFPEVPEEPETPEEAEVEEDPATQDNPDTQDILEENSKPQKRQPQEELRLFDDEE